MRYSWLVASLLSLTIASTSFAQSDADKALARQLGAEGQEALDRGDHKTAEERFKRADQLYHAPTLVLGIARSQAAGKHYLAAQETYNKIIREGAGANSSGAFLKAVDDARTEVEKVASKLGGVVINVSRNGADKVDVTIDQDRISEAAIGLRRPIDPGKHNIRATAAGYRTFSQDIEISEGGSRSVDINLEKDTGPVAAVTPPVTKTTTQTTTTTTAPPKDNGLTTPPPPETKSSGGLSGQKLGAIAAWGVGGAGLVVGIVGGIIASGKHSDLKDVCAAGVDNCPATIPPGQPDAGTKTQDKIDSMHSAATLSTIGFIVAGVGAAGGAVLWFTAPKESKAPTTGFIRPYVGFGSLGAVGQF